MEKGIILFFTLVSVLLFFTGCELDINHSNRPHVLSRPSNEIFEVKKWNKPIGDNATLVESRIEIRDEILMKKFAADISVNGFYYISSLISGVAGERYDVSMESSMTCNGNRGDTQPAHIELREGGLQSSMVCSSKDGNPIGFLLAPGKHTITFSGSNIPNMDEIRIASSPERSVFPLDEYKKEIAGLKNRTQFTGSGSDVTDRDDIRKAASGKETTRQDDPEYDYDVYYVSSTGSYTYRRSIYLTSGTTHTFETKQLGSIAIDTVMYLYKSSSGSPGSNSWVDDNAGAGNYSKITVTIPSTGTYYVMVRAWSEDNHGVADLYHNDSLWDVDIPVAGFKIVPLSSGGVWSNFFTTNKSTDEYENDSYSWAMSGSNTDTAKVVAYNDDFYNSGSDFNWGRQSRIHTNQAIRYFIVSKYNASTVSDWRIYSNALDTKSGENDPVDYFENLQPIDRIRSAAETGGSSVPGSYNCIAWSGGITSYWVWPLDPASPWYSSNALTSFDKFYGNNPARYSGAPNYTRSGATESNAWVDLWAKTSGYTHGSVFRLRADGNYHGYDWESKPGGLARIFHPRYSLDGTDYGSVSKYYRYDGSSSSQLTLQESIDRGLTMIQQVTLNEKQNEKLSRLMAELPEDMLNKFSNAYAAWKKTWKEHLHMSNPRAYAESNEYKVLLNTLKFHGKKAWPFAIKKHQEDGVLVISLLADLMLENNEHIMENMRASGWTKANERKGVYQVPTLNGNWTAFVKEILDSQL